MDNGAVAADDSDTDAFRGASFTGADLTGAKFRDCDLRQVQDRRPGSSMSRSSVRSVASSSTTSTSPASWPPSLTGKPERVLVAVDAQRRRSTRATWDILEGLWFGNRGRAERLTEAALDQRVAGRVVLSSRRCVISSSPPTRGRAARFSTIRRPTTRLGLPHSGYPPQDAAALGVDLAARLSLAEVLEVRAERLALVRGSSTRSPTPTSTGITSRLPSPLHPEEPRLGRPLPAGRDEGRVRGTASPRGPRPRGARSG